MTMVANGGSLAMVDVVLGQEPGLYRDGLDAYVLMVCKRNERLLEACGGIGPFRYECQPVGGDYRFRVSEISSDTPD